FINQVIMLDKRIKRIWGSIFIYLYLFFLKWHVMEKIIQLGSDRAFQILENLIKSGFHNFGLRCNMCSGGRATIPGAPDSPPACYVTQKVIAGIGKCRL